MDPTLGPDPEERGGRGVSEARSEAEGGSGTSVPFGDGRPDLPRDKVDEGVTGGRPSPVSPPPFR